MNKRLVSCLAAVLLAVTCLAARADNERTSGLYTYEFKGNGTVTITGFDWEKNTDNIYLPALLDGYPVTAIADSAFALPDEQRVKGNYVVTLCDGIVSVGDFAFMNAPINTINIPDSLTSIGKGALLVNPDSGYIHINVAPKHSTYATIDGVLFHKGRRELVAFPTIYDDGKQNGFNFRYSIPEGILSVGDYAFYRRRQAPKNSTHWDITIAGTVRSIGEYAFADCEPITSITLSDSIETLGVGAFSFTEEKHKGSSHTFSSTYVENLSVLNQVSTIPANCFASPYMKEKEGAGFVIPENVTRIDEYAFSRARIYETYLENITIHGKVQQIGDHAFDGLRKNSYSYSSANTAVTIQSGVKTIGNEAFANIDFISSVVIEEGLERIGDAAFLNCKALQGVTVPATVTAIGKDAFDKTVTTLTVEQGSYAEHYAIENGLQYKYAENEDDLSWLYGDAEPTEEAGESTDWLNP